MKPLSGTGWRVELPNGLIAKDHKAWGYEGGMIARGWVGDAPVTAVVQHKRLETGFNAWARELARSWLELEQSRRVNVPGAQDAWRLEGVVDFDGLGAKDDRENCVALLAKRGGRVWSLTIRSRPEDGIGAQLEPVLDSFELVDQSSKPESRTSASP